MHDALRRQGRVSGRSRLTADNSCDGARMAKNCNIWTRLSNLFSVPATSAGGAAAIRSCSEARRHWVRSASLLRRLARRQEISSRPGCTAGQLIGHRSYELYGGVEENNDQKTDYLRHLLRPAAVTHRFFLPCANFFFGPTRNPARPQGAGAGGVCTQSRGDLLEAGARQFNVRFTARSSSWRVARCSASWPWSSAWRGTPRRS